MQIPDQSARLLRSCEGLFAIQWSSIHKVARVGDLQGVKFWLEDRKTPVDFKDERGDTPLNIAAQMGHEDVARYLVRNYCQLDTMNNKGWTPGHSAAAADKPEMLALLFESGADLMMSSRGGASPAHTASQTGAVRSLLALTDIFGGTEPLSVQSSSSGMTPAHSASQFGQLEVLRLFIKLGIELDTRDHLVSVSL